MTTTTIAPSRARSLAGARPSWTNLPTGWQAYAIFVGQPVWWLLGLSFFMWPLITLPLVYPMFRRGELRVPRRFGIWFVFLAWMIASSVELQSATRAIAWSWRLSFYLSATILFLYIYNTSGERLPTRSVINALAAYWIIVIAGGWVGVLFPTVAFASPVRRTKSACDMPRSASRWASSSGGASGGTGWWSRSYRITRSDRASR